MQYSGECWAGNKFGRYGRRPQRECNKRCRHDRGRMCGGTWRNSVFALKKTYKPIRSYADVEGEKFLGCFRDAGRRDLPHRLHAGYGNPAKCFQETMKKGLKYAGL